MKIHPVRKLKSGPRTDHEKRNTLIEKIAEWHGTPEEYREQKSLRHLAAHLGVSPNRTFYDIADSAEVYSRLMTTTAGQTLKNVPAVLDVLTEKALKGNNRSAEILLDWVRKVITDGGFLSRMQPVNDISEVMHSVEKSTSNLLELAKTLKDQPTFSKVEEAQYSENDTDKEPEG